MKTPAQMLEGVSLPDGWKVVKREDPSKNSSGGCFSESYIIEGKDGRRAFLKALDFARALRAPDPAKKLQELTTSFNFERDVLSRCRQQNLDRVVIALGDGRFDVVGQENGVVQYLVFELADGGSLRSQIDLKKRFSAAFSLRALHHIATGLAQLHGAGIAHQDVKPSNVLVFSEAGNKLGDLGRAAYQGHVPPHEQFQVAGDPAYAPPELLYGFADPNWDMRRKGCDAYLLGSMIVFLFTGLGMTAQLVRFLDQAHHWSNWRVATYDEVLPYIREAYGKVLDELAGMLPPEARDRLMAAATELCEPDPRLRGHPLSRRLAVTQFSFERYIALFDLLATQAEARRAVSA